MQSFGQVLFAIGCGLLIWAGIIGEDVGLQIRIVNLARLIAGAAFVVAGAVFCVGAMAIEAIQVSAQDQFRMIDHGFDDVKVMIGYPVEKAPEVLDKDEKRGFVASLVRSASVKTITSWANDSKIRKRRTKRGRSLWRSTAVLIQLS